MSRPQTPEVTQALARITAENISPWRAAKDAKIALSTIYNAIKRQRAQQRRDADNKRKREKRAALARRKHA